MHARRRWVQLAACAERSRAWAEGFAANVTPYYLRPPTSLLPRALWARSPLTFSKLTLLCAGVRTLARPRRLGDPDAGAGGRPRNADTDSHPSGPTNQLSPLPPSGNTMQFMQSWPVARIGDRRRCSVSDSAH